jgi:hypothetical protein
MLKYKVEIKLVVLDLYEEGAFMCNVLYQQLFSFNAVGVIWFDPRSLLNQIAALFLRNLSFIFF